MKKVPNPGSDAAIAQGCTCPVLDNAHGQGVPVSRKDGRDQWEYPSFWISSDCPLHPFPDDAVEGDTLAVTPLEVEDGG